jgi:ribosomal protein S12
MRIPTYTIYNTLRKIAWHQVMNKISLLWYIPGSTHTALGLRISISIYLHNSLK